MKTLVNLLVFQKPVTSAASNSPDSSHVLMSVLTVHFLDALTLPLLSDTCVLYLLFLSAPPSLNSSFISLSLPFTLLSPPNLVSVFVQLPLGRRMHLCYLFFTCLFLSCIPVSFSVLWLYALLCFYSFHSENEILSVGYAEEFPVPIPNFKNGWIEHSLFL